jgi:hypothetical protein
MLQKKAYDRQLPGGLPDTDGGHAAPLVPEPDKQEALLQQVNAINQSKQPT